MGVTLFPNMGVLDETFDLGDRVQIIGLIDRYKQNLQLKPLSKSSISVVEKETEYFWSLIPRIDLKSVSAHIGESVIIEPVVLDGSKEFSSNGKRHISFEAYDGKNRVDGIFFDGNWGIFDLDVMKSEKPLRLYVDIDTYEGRPSLILNAVGLSTEKLELPKQDRTNFVPLTDANNYIGKTISISPVTVSGLEKFTSNAGREHIRFKVLQGNEEVSAIIYDGVWDEADYKMLNSGLELTMKVEVDTFNGGLSLVIQSVREAD